ncbi:PH domain-containing protein [Microbacterium sp.]|uniref:PH domain-containing protein n=1 Tax=Microbacterium sp. TaxID=51671 RepID=UPI002810D56A|nr:PH domain-containing protein [Microbacterium sp.]
MSLPPVPAAQPAPTALPGGGASSLADGEWHRMHPLTPLFKGGLVLLIVAGIVVSNMRERVLGWFVALFTPDQVDYGRYGGGDPVDWVLSNNLIAVALVAVLVLLLLLIGAFWVVWRFHQFRITGSHVEVRKGIVFRSHRRAPLDRVHGVNLTRPFPARLIGLAKVEVVGAGTDSNVDLEYLATSRAESVRADILRLASGARNARLVAAGLSPVPVGATPPPAAGTVRSELIGSVNAGVTGLIEGVDLADVAPESVVKIPTGRLIGSQLVSAVMWVVFFGAIYVVSLVAMYFGMTADGEDDASIALGLVGLSVGMGVPLLLAAVGITWAQISKSLRYAIAPTPDGVRVTFGLLTTITETLPPGRIFAVEVSQSLLWRPFGWWTVKINRMSGKSAAQQQSGTAQQFNTVLPVGRREDVERVLSLILPEIPAHDVALLWRHGVEGPVADDPFRTVPARAAWRHPLTWRRHGYALTDGGLLLRRGLLWRRLGVFPLARLQGLSVSQGPLSRAQRVASVQAHSVTGPVAGRLSALDLVDAQALLKDVAHAAAVAVSTDRGHRWAEDAPAPPRPVAPAGGA